MIECRTCYAIQIVLCHTVVLFFEFVTMNIKQGNIKNKSMKYHSTSKAVKLHKCGPTHNTLTALNKETWYLWLSLKASFPFLHEITPRGDILGLHSMRTSPLCRARVWAFNKFWEKSGAMADRVERQRCKYCEGDMRRRKRT